MFVRVRPVLLVLTIAAAGVAGLFGTKVAARGGAHQSPRQAQDVGPTDTSATLTASLVLKVRDPKALEAFVAATEDPASHEYHNFLAMHDFRDRFSPSAADIRVITDYLNSFHIAVSEVYADRLLMRATGTTDAFNRAFDLDVHDFVRNGHHFHKPRHAPKIPLLLRDLLTTIVGPSDEAQFRPKNRRAASALALNSPRKAPAGAVATGAPGDYTVGDVAAMYDINPVYDAHIDGTGRTVGIVTLAGFHPADAFAYWQGVGLTVNPSRITQVHIDGGAVTSADAGSGETSLDVEQSGGLAPGANIRVYDAPNTDASFMDAFYRAVSDDAVDSLSTSWGSAEPFYNEAVAGADFTPELLAFHQAFLEAGAQGISLFASSGDNGAYDMNNGWNDPVNNVLAVDVPCSDPAMTCAGGTTTPYEFVDQGGNPLFVVPTERVWGWDALEQFFVGLGLEPEHFAFPGGTGGGVSVYWPRPSYQAPIAGMRRTEPNQSVVFQGMDLLDLPAHVAGRNVPDVSLNADPESGFIVISSEDNPAGGFTDGIGGTSFVAPQLNGITALLGQASHGRVGFLNPMLYRFQRQYGYGAQSPLVDIVGGDNWFYAGVPGYEPGAGLGVLDVARLVNAARHEANHSW